jgi:sulfur-oxidizing protein SoxX
MKNIYKLSLAIIATAGLAACSSLGFGGSKLFPTADEAVASSWHNLTPEWKARLVQDETQSTCSKAKDRPDQELASRLEKLNQSMGVVYPSNGKLVGDWKKGEAIAQSGFGMRVDDDTKRANGGNCYACHQVTGKELSYGTLGPSLLGYAKLRGQSEAIVKYTYDKIYNAQAFSACSNMPRFGHNKILTPDQIADVVGLLMDPHSPVNQ